MPEPTYKQLLNQYIRKHKALVKPNQGWGSLHASMHLAYSMGRKRGYTDLGTYVDKPMDHDGTGMTPNTIDRRKPEMQLINTLLISSDFGTPYTLWPWYYCETESETTNWTEFKTLVMLVSPDAVDVMTT